MITVDKKQGMAREVGQIWRGDATEFEEVIVDISVGEERTISFVCGKGDDFVDITVPVERVKALLR